MSPSNTDNGFDPLLCNPWAPEYSGCLGFLVSLEAFSSTVSWFFWSSREAVSFTLLASWCEVDTSASLRLTELPTTGKLFWGISGFGNLFVLTFSRFSLLPSPWLSTMYKFLSNSKLLFEFSTKLSDFSLVRRFPSNGFNWTFPSFFSGP